MADNELVRRANLLRRGGLEGIGDRVIENKRDRIIDANNDLRRSWSIGKTGDQREARERRKRVKFKQELLRCSNFWESDSGGVTSRVGSVIIQCVGATNRCRILEVKSPGGDVDGVGDSGEEFD